MNCSSLSVAHTKIRVWFTFCTFYHRLRYQVLSHSKSSLSLCLSLCFVFALFVDWGLLLRKPSCAWVGSAMAAEGLAHAWLDRHSLHRGRCLGWPSLRGAEAVFAFSLRAWAKVKACWLLSESFLLVWVPIKINNCMIQISLFCLVGFGWLRFAVYS